MVGDLCACEVDLDDAPPAEAGTWWLQNNALMLGPDDAPAVTHFYCVSGARMLLLRPEIGDVLRRIPRRPAGTTNLNEEALAALVTRDGMIGTAAV